MSPQEDKPGRPEPSPWSLVTAGMELGLVTAVFTLAGWWLDQKWGTTPALILVGLFIGMVGGTYKLWRTGRRFFKD